VRLRGYRHERLLLVLIALATLTIMHPPSTQDETRMALSQAILSHGSLAIDWYGYTNDRALYGKRYYSDKAPGIAFLAVPAVAVVRAVDRWHDPGHVRSWRGRWHRYALRLLFGGIPFLLSVLLVGRVAEALRTGTGAATAAIFGLGTLFAPLAAVIFGHVFAGVLGFAAFLLATRGRAGWSGFVAGCAVLSEYQSAIVALALLAYLAARGRGPLVRYLLGALPAAVVLAVYDTAAFGSPFHLSYRYVANDYTAAQQQGFFGIHAPGVSDVRAVVIGGSGLSIGRGLLITSPVLLACVVGLWLLWRRGLRWEAAIAVFVAAAYFVYTAGYFLAYGGTSPGPRFFTPALPFLFLGLPEALRRWPRTTLALGVLSIAVMTLNSLAWFWNDRLRLTKLPETIYSNLGAPTKLGVALVCAGALAATALATASWHEAAGPASR
jgi:hypothetical protein